MRNKRILSCLILAAILFSILPNSSFSQQSIEFIDDYESLNLLHSSSTISNLAIATSDQSSKHGITDRNRLYKKSQEGDLDTGTYVVYEFGRRMTSFVIESIYMKKSGNITASDLIFETSVNGIDYTPFNHVSKMVERENTWESELFRGVTFSSEEEPSPDARYLRITFGSTVPTGSSNTLQLLKTKVVLAEESVDYKEQLREQISQANSNLSTAVVGNESGMYPMEAYEKFKLAIQVANSVLSNSDSTNEEYMQAKESLAEASADFARTLIISVHSVISDYCDGLNLAYEYHSDIGVAVSSPEKMDNDGGRYYRKTQQQGGYVLYKTLDQHMFSSVVIDAWYNKRNNQIAGDMIVEVSSDGTNFSPVQALKTIINGGNWQNDDWRLIRFEVRGIPTGAKFARISFGDGINTGAAWTIQVGNIILEQTKNFREMLGETLAVSRDLIDSTVVGTASGECSQQAKDRFAAAISDADSVFNNAAVLNAFESAYLMLVSEKNVFEQSLIYLVQWPSSANIAITGTTSKSISIGWDSAIGSDIEYMVYLNGNEIGSTADTHYTIEELAHKTAYNVGVVAVENGEFSAMLGPVTVETTGFEAISKPDFSKITPDSFNDNDYLSPLQWTNDKRGIPYYYYYYLSDILNAIHMDGDKKGFVDIFVSRTMSAFNPGNVRVQEAYLPIAYFYARNDSWNIYYNMFDVKIRLEAVIEHTLSLQKSNGAFPQSSDATYDLAGTTFFLNFMGQTVKLLKDEEIRNPDFQSISPELMERIRAASEKAIKLVFNNQDWWNYGTAYSNQYGLIWSAAAAYLEFYPDAEIEQMLREKFAMSDAFISPAGFYYEDKSFDFNYNIGVHNNNIIAEYNYFKNTEFESKLIEEQTKFFDWISYNLIIEPDGSWFTANDAASRRIPGTSTSIYRKKIPISEQIPIARAFVRSESDVETDVESAKRSITKNGSWPNIASLPLNGGNSYNAYAIFETLFDSYVPTDAERQQAIDSLPYMAKKQFNQVRGDTLAGVQFSFIKKPDYYIIFNAANKALTRQVYGLGVLWHPEGGIMLKSQSENEDTKASNGTPLANDMSWGTKPYYAGQRQSGYRVYENAALIPEYYKVNDQEITIPHGILDVPDGDFEISYRLGKGAGTKTLKYTDEGIEVDITHPGEFQECFPLMVRSEDRFEVHENKFVLIRGRSVMEITFDRQVEFDIIKKNYTQSRYTLHNLSAKSMDMLKYTIKLSIAEPKLNETSGTIQVSIDDISATVDDMPSKPGNSTDNSIENEYIELIDKMASSDELVTRAEFISLLCNAFGLVSEGNDVPMFNDVSKDSPYYDAIAAAKEKGLVRGITPELFGTENVITLEEMEIIAFRAYQYKFNKIKADNSNLATGVQAADVLKRLSGLLE